MSTSPWRRVRTARCSTYPRGSTDCTWRAAWSPSSSCSAAPTPPGPSPTNSRSARSSCPITGISSTSCGSACSPSSTSSTSQGTASELDQRQAQAPGRRLRGTAARARRCRAPLRVAHPSGGRRAGVGTGRGAAGHQRGQGPVRRELLELPRPRRAGHEPGAGPDRRLGGGPPIPDDQQVSSAGADTALGSQLFQANCAQCHGFAGAGGALTYGKSAPALTQATPTEIYEAMLTGPEAMPVFSDGALSPQAKRDMIAYIVQTRTEPNPGGFSLGRAGPVTEGLVVFLGGMGFLVLI